MRVIFYLLFSEFNTIFDQILREDIEYAYVCLQGYISFLRGPKQRPTKDPYKTSSSGDSNGGMHILRADSCRSEGRRRLRSADFLKLVYVVHQ